MSTFITKVNKVEHDLNNMLTVILANAEFGLQDLASDHIAYAHFLQIKKATESAMKTLSGPAPDSRNKKHRGSGGIEEKSGPETIMVVDDERPVRDVAIKLLNTMGYQTLAAESASEALALFDKNRENISLVLTDVAMPQTSGIEMALKMKARNPDLPVIFVTGQGFDNNSPEVQALCKPYKLMLKPYNIQGMAIAIQDMLALNLRNSG